MLHTLNKHIMKKINYMLLLIFLCYTSCDEHDLHPEPELIDSISDNTIDQLIDINRRIPDLLFERLDVEQKELFYARIQNARNKDQLLTALNSISSDGNQLYELLREQHALLDKEVYTDHFNSLSYEERVSLLSNRFANYRGKQFQGRLSTDCPSQYQRDLSRCHDTALIEAAVCGGFAPTLIGALICAGVVIVQNELCHKYAYEDYVTCKNEG